MYERGAFVDKEHTMSQDVITVEGLRKRYGPVTAVAGVAFQVQAGEIFGMVGPNGSGKTTTIECVEGLRRPDQGAARVLGLDPWQDAYALRERLGIQLQSANLPPRIRVEEALDLFASFYRKTRAAGPLLEELGLADKRRAFFSQLSGGQKQRLFVALALINHPQVVFLDELTTGLDPQARHATWNLVRTIRERGATVFLTTHFMEEAERLCDRVAILDHGRIIALDTPQTLIDRLGMNLRITFLVNGRSAGRQAGKSSTALTFNPAVLGAIDGVRRVEQQGEEVVVYGQGQALVSAILSALEATRLPFHNLRTEPTNLEDVFLALTGRAVRE
jgi:ABC-2 type transport system ATP-binding protein